jgi:acetyl esterase/lipase
VCCCGPSPNRDQLGWSGKSSSVASIEAGANLAAFAARVNRDRHGPRLAAQILLMPMLETALINRSMREAGQWVVAGRCASGYPGYLHDAAERVHPNGTPLNASRLKDLPPTLIFFDADDPLRDEAYGIKLIGHGMRTSMVRLPTVALEAQDARAACAATTEVIAEIDAFLDALSLTIHSPRVPT